MNPSARGTWARRVCAVTLSAGLAWSTSACGGPAKDAAYGATSENAAYRPPLSPQELDYIADLVAVARQLPKRRPVVIESLDRPEFLAKLRDGTLDPTPEEQAREAAFLLGFDFIPPPGQRAGIATMDEVLEEQVVAFYAPSVDRVYVPRLAPESEEDFIEQRGVVAHEVQHALQEQHFDVPDLMDLEGDDARLAYLALLEGDAMVAMGAFLGADYGAPIRRTLINIVDVTSQVDLEELAEGHDNAQLERALAIARDRLMFPYDRGMQFVTDLYRAGGFKLIDRAYADPPLSTEHILHPERYLRGDDPHPMPELMPPPGFEPLMMDTLGELQIRTMLERCLDKNVAHRAAEGWGGDRFMVAAEPQADARSRLMVLWATSWDTRGDAIEAEQALRDAAPCFSANEVDEDDVKMSIAANTYVVRSDNRVAFSRGIEASAAQPLMDAALASIEPPPPPVARSELRILPWRPLPEPRRGTVYGDVYESAWLGVTARVPAGMHWSLAEPEAELWIERPDVLVAGGLFLSDRVTSERFNEKAFRDVQDAFAEVVSMQGLAVVPIQGGTFQTPLGPGVARTWSITGTTVQLRMVLVPICDGTGSLIFVQAWEDQFANAVLDGWLGSFRWRGEGPLPVCGRLNPT